LQEILDEGHLQIVKALDVRWLSHERAVRSLRISLKSVIAALESDAAGKCNATAKGLAGYLKDFRFVCRLLMMCDILPPLAQLSRIFQVFNFL